MAALQNKHLLHCGIIVIFHHAFFPEVCIENISSQKFSITGGPKLGRLFFFSVPKVIPKALTYGGRPNSVATPL